MSKRMPSLSSDPAFILPRDELESPDGDRIIPRPDAISWRLDQWLDDTTVVGFANEGLDNPDRVKETKPSSLMTCTVPDGSCTIVPDSDDAILPAPSLH
jgi:hypothetical protein